METHHAKADRPFAAGRIFRARHFIRGAVDIILQHIVEETHDVLDESLVAVPLFPFLKVERGQAAYRRTVIAQVVNASWQCDFAAQVGGRYLKTEIAVMLRHHLVHSVGKDDVRLARCKAGFHQLLEQAARINCAAHFARLR